MERYEFESLVECAETLHEHTTGSGVTLSSAEEGRILKFLNMRLREWQTSRPESRLYDEAVRTLVRAAIDEYTQSHWGKQRQAATVKGSCDHPAFRQEIAGRHRTGDLVCTHCGEVFSSDEVQSIESTKRRP